MPAPRPSAGPWAPPGERPFRTNRRASRRASPMPRAPAEMAGTLTGTPGVDVELRPSRRATSRAGFRDRATLASDDDEAGGTPRGFAAVLRGGGRGHRCTPLTLLTPMP